MEPSAGAEVYQVDGRAVLTVTVPGKTPGTTIKIKLGTHNGAKSKVPVGSNGLEKFEPVALHAVSPFQELK